ncbi:endonuclease/exonuclease/phosphatase family protein [Modestobacter altitudinis]|uniref:endonuclease/exonuclease/phosphatase family protein n=1 Tax=Modestobacter altitudinis TaxID=2213158 RepID=UPI00110CD1B8|nr:endonuclease/exonuclease/phosphatase family protein [Modestobacter altitudinis]
MRIASFNVENLFERARALDPSHWETGRPVLERQARVNAVLGRPEYSDDDKAEIVDLLDALGLSASDAGPLAVLRQNRGHLLTRHPDGRVEITASGRADWVGWVELTKGPVDELSTRHTGQVIRDLAPDVLGTVEVEDRPTLKGFSRVVLPEVGAPAYEHAMVIDGNDDRGIDVGVLLKEGYEISAMTSHVDDVDDRGAIFSRDCPEYAIRGPGGFRLLLLVNHLKSKGFGSQQANDARRRRQAVRVAQLYEAARAAGEDHVAVVGDFNDSPESKALEPLLAGTDLRDITESPRFTNDGRPGTFRNGTKGTKIDYVLLSPSLFAVTSGGGIHRRGVWGGKNGTLWEHYPDMAGPHQAASDHAAIWADIEV